MGEFEGFCGFLRRAALASSPAMLIDEEMVGPGISRTYLELAHGTLVLSDDRGLRAPLSTPVIEVVMRRYGRPLDAQVVLTGERLELGDGKALRSLQHQSTVDVLPWTYVVFECPGQEPLAAVARTVAGALRHLAGAGTGTRES